MPNIVRRNLGSAASAFEIIQSGTIITPGVSYAGKTWTRIASTATTAGGARQKIPLDQLKNFVPYAAEWEFANDTATAVDLTIDWCDQGYATPKIQPGEARRVSTGTTTPVAGNGSYTDVYRFADVQVNTLSSSILVRALLLEELGIKGGYFDGNSLNENGYVNSWEGAQGSSVSVQYLYPAVVRKNLCTNPNAELNVNGWGGNAALVTRDTSWSKSGSASFKVTPNVPGNALSDMRAGSTSNIPFGIQPGKTYTLSAVIRLSAAQSGTLDSRGRRILIFVSTDGVTYNLGSTATPQAANMEGELRLSLTRTIPENATGVLLMLGCGSDASADAVWWDEILLEETSVAGNINVLTNPDFPNNMLTWQASGSGISTIWDSTVGRSALGSLKCTLNSTGAWDANTFVDRQPAKQGDTWEAQAYVFANAGAMNCRVNVDFRDRSGNSVGNYGGTVVTLTNGKWNRLSASAVAPPNTVAVFIRVYTTAGAVVGDTFWIDDCFLHNRSAAGYFDGNSGGGTFRKEVWDGAQNASASSKIVDLPQHPDYLSLNILEMAFWKAVSGLGDGYSLADYKKKGLEVGTGLTNTDIDRMEKVYWSKLSSRAPYDVEAYSVVDYKVALGVGKSYFASFFK